MNREPHVLDTHDGKIVLVTPYHIEVVAFAKQLMGKWKDTYLEDGSTVKGWILLPKHRARAEETLRKIFPPDTEKILKVCLWDSKGNWSPSAPVLDGSAICVLGVDYKGQPWVSGVRHINGEQVLHNTLEAGKTANNKPVVKGRIVMTALVRSEAKVSWPGLSGELVTLGMYGISTRRAKSLLKGASVRVAQETP